MNTLKKRWNRLPRALRIGLAVVVVALLAEIFLFNFRHWESVGWRRAELADYRGVVVKLKDGKGTLEVGDIDRVANNLYIECVVVDKSDAAIPGQVLSMALYGRDSVDELPFQMGSRKVLTSIARTRYMKLNLLGETKSLQIRFTSKYPEAKRVIVREIAVNAPVPLFLSWRRLLLLAALLAALCAFRPGSPLYRSRFSARFRGRRAAVCATCLALCALTAFAVDLNGKEGDAQETQTQFHELARALAKGQVWLDTEPSEALKAMENPYDADLREELLGEDGFKRDYAYFKGRYYCYFGVLPIALTYLPYYMATGNDLPASRAMLVFGLLMAVGVCAFVYEWFERRRDRLPFALYPLACFAMLFASGLFFGVRAVKLYALPILCGAGLTLWGLFFWLRARRRGVDSRRSRIDVAAGSLLIALTVLARPQFILSSLMALPLFWDEILRPFRERRVNWGFWLCLILPVLPVAAVTMAYNRARFGSVFDFGATYNLCAGDMRARGWRMDRVPLALLYYLFVPVVVRPKFPFMIANTYTTSYLGRTICEIFDIYGGLFALAPFLMIGFAAFARRRRNVLSDPLSRSVARVSVLLALLILVLDAQVAGIVARYRMDFGWLFCLAALLVQLEVEAGDEAALSWKKLLRAGLLATVLAAVAYECLLLFAQENVELYWHPDKYFAFKTMLEFWT